MERSVSHFELALAACNQLQASSRSALALTTRTTTPSPGFLLALRIGLWHLQRPHRSFLQPHNDPHRELLSGQGRYRISPTNIASTQRILMFAFLGLLNAHSPPERLPTIRAHPLPLSPLQDRVWQRWLPTPRPPRSDGTPRESRVPTTPGRLRGVRAEARRR